MFPLLSPEALKMINQYKLKQQRKEEYNKKKNDLQKLLKTPPTTFNAMIQYGMIFNALQKLETEYNY